MDEAKEGRERARLYVLEKLGYHDERWLSEQAQVDAGTVRTFLAGETWPQSQTRRAIEEALGIERGRLQAIKQGRDYPVLAGGDGPTDPIEAAIGASEVLTRGQKLELLTHYVKLIEAGAAGEVKGA